MKIVVGFFLFVLVAEQIYVNGETLSKQVFSVAKESNRENAKLLNASTVFVKANPKSNVPSTYDISYETPEGEFIDYVELFNSKEPDYAGTKLTFEALDIMHPSSIEIHLTNKATKGIDVRVLLYGAKLKKPKTNDDTPAVANELN